VPLLGAQELDTFARPVSDDPPVTYGVGTCAAAPGPVLHPVLLTPGEQRVREFAGEISGSERERYVPSRTPRVTVAESEVRASGPDRPKLLRERRQTQNAGRLLSPSDSVNRWVRKNSLKNGKLPERDTLRTRRKRVARDFFCQPMIQQWVAMNCGDELQFSFASLSDPERDTPQTSEYRALLTRGKKFEPVPDPTHWLTARDVPSSWSAGGPLVGRTAERLAAAHVRQRGQDVTDRHADLEITSPFRPTIA